MSEETWGYLVWYGGWIGLFLTLELPAVLCPSLVPWPSFSRTVWTLRDKNPNVILAVVGFLAALAFHFSFQGYREKKRR